MRPPGRDGHFTEKRPRVKSRVLANADNLIFPGRLAVSINIHQDEVSHSGKEKEIERAGNGKKPSGVLRLYSYYNLCEDDTRQWGEYFG
jgi:hypothetical protein